MAKGQTKTTGLINVNGQWVEAPPVTQEDTENSGRIENEQRQDDLRVLGWSRRTD
jgi:hypothetical protein